MEENQNPKSNKSIFIVVGIMAIIIIALVGYILYSKSNDGKEVAGDNTNTSLSNRNEKDDDEKDSKENKVDEDEDENESKKDKNTSSKNSTFGKKDKNETSSKNETNTTNTSEKPSTSANLTSGDWKSGEFVFDGVSYKLNSDYKNLVDNGWSVNLADAGYEDGYILNKNDKTYSTVDLENDKYDDAEVSIGFINLGDSAKDVSECQFWSIGVDNKYSDTPVEFELPGGVKSGCSLADIEAAYGKPTDESNIYRSEDLKYTKYTYESDDKDTPMLELTVFDEDGLTEFDYKIY